MSRIVNTPRQRHYSGYVLIYCAFCSGVLKECEAPFSQSYVRLKSILCLANNGFPTAAVQLGPPVRVGSTRIDSDRLGSWKKLPWFQRRFKRGEGRGAKRGRGKIASGWIRWKSHFHAKPKYRNWTSTIHTRNEYVSQSSLFFSWSETIRVDPTRNRGPSWSSPVPAWSEMSEGKSQPTFCFAAVQQVRIVACWVKQKQSIKNPEVSQFCLNFFCRTRQSFCQVKTCPWPDKWPA